MTLTLEIAPEIEAALEARARRAGVPVAAYAVRVLALDVRDEANGADIMAPLYAESLASGGELTAATDAPGDLHEYSADELAAMEAGEFETPFEQPLRRAA